MEELFFAILAFVVATLIFVTLFGGIGFLITVVIVVIFIVVILDDNVM